MKYKKESDFKFIENPIYNYLFNVQYTDDNNKLINKFVSATNEAQAIEYVLKKYPIENRDNIYCQCINLKKGLMFDLDI